MFINYKELDGEIFVVCVHPCTYLTTNMNINKYLYLGGCHE